MKSQAIFKSIEKLSDSRILDIYLRVLKTEERTTGALETSAGVPLMAISVILFYCFNVILIQKEKRKKERLKERLRIRNKKKKEKKKEEKKTPCRIRTPGPQSRRSEFFCASHH